ncbi:MAG: hypothetical protein OXP08_06350, partial [bacterium]|nr:hypothetical protein [bacterium]
PGAVARRAGRTAAAARSLLDAASGPSGDAPIRRWAADAGEVGPASAQLAAAVAPDDARVAAFVDRWERLRSREGPSAPPPLSGSEVMAHLGIDAGPDVGAALRHLEELRIAGGPLDGEEARRRLSEWWDRGRKRRVDR